MSVCWSAVQLSAARWRPKRSSPVIASISEAAPTFSFTTPRLSAILLWHNMASATSTLTSLFAPFPDGRRLFVWKDLERTCDSIAGVSPEDAENYNSFINDWRPLAQAMVESFMHAPSPLNLVKTLGFQSGVHRDLRRRLTSILGSYGNLLRKTFVSPQVQAVVGWMAAQSGPPPTELLSAPFALWQPMYHCSGVKRPLGGSGMLTEALARMIRAHGGTIATDTSVDRILVENGRAVGVRTLAGEILTAKRAVVSGAHIHNSQAPG